MKETVMKQAMSKGQEDEIRAQKQKDEADERAVVSFDFVSSFLHERH